MNLNRTKGIALLVVAALLLTGAIGVTWGGEERSIVEEWPPVGGERPEKVRLYVDLSDLEGREIPVLAMSPEERQREALRLFGYYPKERELELPAGVGRLELRSVEEGLTTREVEAIRADVIAEAIAKGLLNAESRVLFEANFKDYGVVVAYGYFVGPDGVPSQYVAIAGNNRVALDVIHQRAREWYQKERQRPGKHEMQQTTARPHWIVIGRRSQERHLPPYGSVIKQVYLLQLANDDLLFSGMHDYFGVRQRVIIQPGIMQVGWNSDWQSNAAYSKQEWGWGDIARRLEDWGPVPIIIGTAYDYTKVHICFGCCFTVLEWMWEQAPQIKLIPDPCTHHIYGKWFQYYDHDSWGSMNETSLEPGTTAQVYQQPAGSGPHRLILLQANAQFRDPHWYGGASYKTIWLPALEISVQY
ncbi:MAG: hypothetical protein AAGB97_00850 [Dehalococcoidia bacterium]|nr:hypothetical protein [Chloroflexota bacterium]